ncbi:MAG: hypothetical protein AMXMBFR58_20840 [Phycisphaerae bacterium]
MLAISLVLVFAFAGLTSGAVATLLVAGVFVTLKGHRWDPSHGRLRCPRCWYDLSATPGARACSECGRPVGSAGELGRTRRNRLLQLAGVIVAMSAIAWPVYEHGRDHVWRYLPDAVVVRFADTSDSAWNELCRRGETPAYSFSPSTTALAGRAALARAADAKRIKSVSPIADMSHRFFRNLPVEYRLQVWSLKMRSRFSTFDVNLWRPMLEDVMADQKEEAEALLRSWKGDRDPAKEFVTSWFERYVARGS